MKKLIALVLALVMTLALFTACGAKTDEPVVENNEGGDVATTASNGKILNFVGNLGDFAFGDMSQAITLKLAEEYNFEQTCVEYGTDTSVAVVSLMNAIETTEFDYVVCQGTTIFDQLLENSEFFPNTSFIVYDVGPDYQWENPNVYGVSFGQNEGSFLAAVYEAAMTKTGVISVLIRRDAPILNDFYSGWLHGARYAKNELGYDISWENAYLGGDNVSDAYETALAMLTSGTDIMYCVAGNHILGATQAMDEKGGIEAGYMTIGVDIDQWSYFANAELEAEAVGYETIVTSMIKDTQVVVRDLFEGIEAGTMEPGNKYYGVASGGVALADNEFYQEISTDEAKQLVLDTKQAIVDGTLDVLSYYDFPDYETFAKYRDDPTFEFTPAA